MTYGFAAFLYLLRINLHHTVYPWEPFNEHLEMQEHYNMNVNLGTAVSFPSLSFLNQKESAVLGHPSSASVLFLFGYHISPKQ